MGIRYFERSIRPLARPLVGLPIGMTLIALAACGATPADKTGQRQNELVTCNKISLGSIHDINPVIPSPKIQPWTQFETHEGVLQHIIGQSAIRDGLCSGPAPRDCVSVWMEDNIYYVRPLNFPNLLNCNNFNSRLAAFFDPSRAGQALAGVEACKAASNCWNNWSPPPPSSPMTLVQRFWELWLPTGMAFTNTKAAMMLHYPPSACWDEKDYIAPTDPTVASWNRKLAAYGITGSNQYLYNSWMDVEPIMALGQSVNMPSSNTYFNTSAANSYIGNMMNWLVSPPSSTNNYYNLPLLIAGSDPRSVILNVIGARAASPWSIAPSTSYNAMSVNSFGVTTTTAGAGGKKIAMMASNHPDVAILANCTENFPNAQYTGPLQTEIEDLISVCWWKTMSDQMLANPTNNPDPNQIRADCEARWNTPSPGDKHTLCKLAVQDYVPVTYDPAANPTTTAHYDWRCTSDAEASAFCHMLDNRPCLNFRGPSHFGTNLNCKIADVSGSWEKTCNDGLDNDGDGQVDCADSDCGNAANCDAGDGECCVANGGKGCRDEEGENYVCACDPSCCTTSWDAKCAAEYRTARGTDPRYGACTSGFGGTCTETSCTNGLDDDGNGKTDCADQACASMSACEPSGAGDGACCTTHSDPGCEDDFGQYAVCNTSGYAYCCTTQWDAACVTKYKALNAGACFENTNELACRDGVDNDGNGLTDVADPVCSLIPDGYPQTSCCAASSSPRCIMAEVVDAVCATIPSCCTTAWSSTCVNAYVNMSKYDYDGDGVADDCELTGTPGFLAWSHFWDYRSDKSTTGVDPKFPTRTGEVGGAFQLTPDSSTAGYGTALIRSKNQSAASNPFTVYFEYRTKNVSGQSGHGISFFWNKSGDNLANNPAPSGDGLGFYTGDNTGFAILLNAKLGQIRLMGGSTLLASTSVTDLLTGGSWKRVAIKVQANSVTVYTWSGTDWVSRFSYNHTVSGVATNWDMDSRGLNRRMGFGAGTSTGNASEISLRNVSFSENARAFVTSELGNGDLGGVGYADAKCQRLANAASLGGVYKAWLSSTSGDAAARMAHSLMPYKRVSGTQLASAWGDLTDGLLAATLSTTELGSTLSGYQVWTGSAYDGSLSTPNCQNWTSSLATDSGLVGLNSSASQWTSNTSIACSNTNIALYCLEQPYEADSPLVWTQMSGTLSDVASWQTDVLWGVNSLDAIWTLANGSWQSVAGTLRRMSVQSDGNAWGRNAAGTVYERVGTTWTTRRSLGDATDVGAGGGQVWISTSGTSGNDIYRHTGSGTWSQLQGWASAIDVDDEGNAWTVGSSSSVWGWVPNGSCTTNCWVSYGSPSAMDIGVGAGQVYIIDSSNSLYYLVKHNSSWSYEPSFRNQSGNKNAAKVAVDQSGIVWITATDGTIWRGSRQG